MTLDRRAAIYEALARLGHPDRLLVLDHCAAGPSSPKTVAQHLAEIAHPDDAPAQKAFVLARLGGLAYHTRALADEEMIVNHSRRQIRGAVQHFYVTSAAGRGVLDALDLYDDELRQAQADAGAASMQAAFWRSRALELGAKPGEYKRHLKALEKAQ